MSRHNKRRKKQGKGAPPKYRKQHASGTERPAVARSAVALEQPSRPAPGKVLSLDPLAPVIVRSGRPFDAQAGADKARFPPPSTVAGCLRTAWARAADPADPAFGPELANLTVTGPLLTRVDAAGAHQALVPKPADALYFGHGDAARCVRAEPRVFAPECGADLPEDLLPVQLTKTVAGKPGSGPAWWAWDDLLAFRGGEAPDHARLERNGWSPPPGDRRTHVAINPATGAADAGRLFQTEGLDLDAPNGLDVSAPSGLRLLVRFGEPLGATLVHLGGERRLAALQPESESAWPEPPPGWLERIALVGGISLTLLTPAVFAAGYRPGWLDAALTGSPPGAPGVRLQLMAAAVERWQPHSGWDLAEHRPRPTRKLAGAGATYWFRLLGDADLKALANLWLASISDLAQDRRDGFGLALPAAWTPPSRPLA